MSEEEFMLGMTEEFHKKIKGKCTKAEDGQYSKLVSDVISDIVIVGAGRITRLRNIR